ncbi:MAG: hypothetical protein LBU85_11150 [Treponema sp.]|jgi:hypothetical protein|nr:hypothetical protein [Treponema sp.]
MKQNNAASLLTALFLSILFAACIEQQQKVVFRPDDAGNPQELSRPFDSWEITMSQNGQGSGDIPEWVRWYINNEINEIEALDRFYGKYIFIGRNGGGNFNALQQWANGFTVEQDLPRLITRRVERRLITSASLYPDDEYGEYFEFLIREISNGEYSGAVKEQTFWLKRKLPESGAEADANAGSNSAAARERYEFLVLVSVDKETLQKQLRGIMAGIKTKVSPTREQASAVARIKNTFFEGF